MYSSYNYVQGGLIRIGNWYLPKNSTDATATLATGFAGRRNYVSFVMRGTSTLWALEDICTYRRVSVTEAQRQVPGIATRGSDDPGWRFVTGGDVTVNGWNPSRPTLARTTCGAAVVRWTWSRETNRWEEDMASKVYFREPLSSLVGRSETSSSGSSAEYVLYATGRKSLFRIRPDARGAVSTVATAPPGTLFRGTAIPPDWRPLVTPSPTPSRPATRSATGSRSRSASRTAKPRG